MSTRRLSRRRFLQISALTGAAAVAGFGGSLIWANNAVRQFENDIVIPLTPWLVNTYLVRGQRDIVVDTGFPQDESAIVAALTQHAVTPSLLFITHGHYDHFGSAAALQRRFGAQVSIHRDEAARLTAGLPTQVEVLSATGRLLSVLPMGERAAVPVSPDLLLDGDGALNGMAAGAEVIHTPGHTHASLTLLINGYALIGDLLAGSLFYPNKPDYPFFIDDATDQPQIVTSVERLLDAGAHTFFPGHGLPFDRAAALRWREAAGT
jgi:glyoxylase-like metal-dependent hydrolase (beta-lactamase superfamily II)